MTSKNYLWIFRDIEPRIPSEPTSGREIAKLVGVWSEKSVRLALLQLWQAGKIKRRVDENDRPPSGQSGALSLLEGCGSMTVVTAAFIGLIIGIFVETIWIAPALGLQPESGVVADRICFCAIGYWMAVFVMRRTAA